MKNFFKAFLISMLCADIAVAATTNSTGTAVVYPGGSDVADISVINSNFVLVVKRLDAIYVDAGWPLTNSLKLYTNCISYLAAPTNDLDAVNKLYFEQGARTNFWQVSYGTTNAVAFKGGGDATLSLRNAADTQYGSLVLSNLTVLGTQNTYNANVIDVETNRITLNANITNGTPVLDAYFYVRRGDSNSAVLKWIESTHRWVFGIDSNDEKVVWIGVDGSLTASNTITTPHLAATNVTASSITSLTAVVTKVLTMSGGGDINGAGNNATNFGTLNATTNITLLNPNTHSNSVYQSYTGMVLIVTNVSGNILTLRTNGADVMSVGVDGSIVSSNKMTASSGYFTNMTVKEATGSVMTAYDNLWVRLGGTNYFHASSTNSIGAYTNLDMKTNAISGIGSLSGAAGNGLTNLWLGTDTVVQGSINMGTNNSITNAYALQANTYISIINTNGTNYFYVSDTGLVVVAINGPLASFFSNTARVAWIGADGSITSSNIITAQSSVIPTGTFYLVNFTNLTGNTLTLYGTNWWTTWVNGTGSVFNAAIANGNSRYAILTNANEFTNTNTIPYITGTNAVFGYGLSLNNIHSGWGSVQIGEQQGAAGFHAGTNSVGTIQSGKTEDGGLAEIHDNAEGAFQHVYVGAGTRALIGGDAKLAGQIGFLKDTTVGATNWGVGALQLFSLSNSGERAFTGTNGFASLLLGHGTATNKNSIVANGNQSHGDGSITMDSFWGMTGILDSVWMTNLTVGAVTTLSVRATDVYSTNLYIGTGVVDSLSFTNMTGGTGTFTMVIGEGSGLTNMPFSFALSYGAMTTANDTNSILWSAPAPYTCTITNLNWYTRSPDVDVTGNLFLASSTKESTTWEYQCYTNMDFDGSTQKNASVSMVVSQGWSIGMMVSESTGSTVRIRGK